MKKSQRILSIATLFFWASEYCHAPYFAPYLTSLGFAAGLIGIMVGMYGFTQAVVRIPLGIATDKTGGYLFVVRMGTIFTTVSSFWLMFATTEWEIIVCRILAGLAASTWIAFTILFASYYEASEGTSAMVNANKFNSSGKLLAFALGTIAAAIWGYRIPLVMSFLTGLVAVVFSFRLKDVPIKKEPVKLRDLFGTFKDVTVLIPAFFAVLMHFLLQGTAYSFTSNVAEARGASEITIGILTMLFTLVQIVASSPMNKYVIKKIEAVKSVAIGFIMLGISCAIIALTKSVWPIVIGQIIGGLGNMMTSAVLMGLTIKYVPAEKKSTAMGLFQAIYGVGMMLGPVLVGRVVEASGYGAAYYMCTAICAFAFISAMVLIPTAEKIGQKRTAK